MADPRDPRLIAIAPGGLSPPVGMGTAGGPPIRYVVDWRGLPAGAPSGGLARLTAQPVPCGDRFTAKPHCSLPCLAAARQTPPVTISSWNVTSPPSTPWILLRVKGCLLPNLRGGPSGRR